MNETNEKRCGPCEPPAYERNSWFDGKLLTAHDFADEQQYLNEKRWLGNRMLHGWGVVCGLEVKIEREDLRIEPGMAIDCHGHEIVLCEPQRISLDGLEEYARDLSRAETELAVCLEYAEEKTEPVPIMGDPEQLDTDGVKYNRIREGFKLEIRPECVEPDALTLARITIRREATGTRPIVHTRIDTSARRRLLHRCAPRIVDVGWKELRVADHAPEWSTFVEGVRAGRIEVAFDRPIRADTLHGQSFMVAVRKPDPEGYAVARRIPCNAVEYTPGEGRYRATFVGEPAWFEVLRPPESTDAIEVEITLRGSLILGDDGTALDGDHIGGRLPSGNGVPGGDFVDWLTVVPDANR